MVVVNSQQLASLASMALGILSRFLICVIYIYAPRPCSSSSVPEGLSLNGLV